VSVDKVLSSQEICGYREHTSHSGTTCAVAHISPSRRAMLDAAPRNPIDVRIRDLRSQIASKELDVFPSESTPAAANSPALPALARLFAGMAAAQSIVRRSLHTRIAVGGSVRRHARPLLVACLVAALAGTTAWRYTPATGAADGVVHVQSDPAGAAVYVDGALRGTTPVAVTLARGSHSLRVESEGRTTPLTVDVLAGRESSHYITWATPAVAPQLGGLLVVTDPPGLPVSIDGRNRGVSPLSVSDLSTGTHQVAIGMRGGVQRRTVDVTAGAVASLVIATTPVVSSGWLSVRSALPLAVYEDGKIIGTTESERIMLPTGEHTLDFVIDTLGFRQTSRLVIEPNTVRQLSVELPAVPVNINASPWAEVWVDGRRIGETPIGRSMQTIGEHQVAVRHPEHGEKRATMVVTLKGPSRLSVDMRAQ
jgi:hypothetical protein